MRAKLGRGRVVDQQVLATARLELPEAADPLGLLDRRDGASVHRVRQGERILDLTRHTQHDRTRICQPETKGPG